MERSLFGKRPETNQDPTAHHPNTVNQFRKAIDLGTEVRTYLPKQLVIAVTLMSFTPYVYCFGGVDGTASAPAAPMLKYQPYVAISS